jgi:DNA-binding response OmpR family regulator
MKTTQPVHVTPQGDLIVVDDNLRLSTELSLVLQASGWSVRCADDGETLRAQVAQKEPAIVVLDLNLPGEDGISLCKWLRRTHPRVCIVLLTARVMGMDRTEGYVAGADIYLTKPTRPEELLAVVHNLWRRSQFSAPSVTKTQDQPWTLHIKALLLRSPQLDMLSLTPSECVLLQTLASANGTCTYGQLIDRMGSAGVDDNVDKARLEVLVSRLRRKFSTFNEKSFEIKTVHSVGYSLTLPLAIKVQ